MSDQNSPIDFDTADFASEEELDRAIAKETGTGGALRRDWKLLPKALVYLRPYRKLAALSIAVDGPARAGGAGGAVAAGVRARQRAR